jgi:hypothetical protein
MLMNSSAPAFFEPAWFRDDCPWRYDDSDYSRGARAWIEHRHTEVDCPFEDYYDAPARFHRWIEGNLAAREVCPAWFLNRYWPNGYYASR